MDLVRKPDYEIKIKSKLGRETDYEIKIKVKLGRETDYEIKIISYVGRLIFCPPLCVSCIDSIHS